MESKGIVCTFVAGASSAGFTADEVSALHTRTGSTVRVLATVGRGTQQALESMRGHSVRFSARRGPEHAIGGAAWRRWTLTTVLVGQVHREAGPDGFEERVMLAIGLTTEVA